MEFRDGHSKEILDQYNHESCLRDSRFIAARQEYKMLLEEVRKYSLNHKPISFLFLTAHPPKRPISLDTSTLFLCVRHIDAHIGNAILGTYHNTYEFNAILESEGWSSGGSDYFSLKLDI